MKNHFISVALFLLVISGCRLVHNFDPFKEETPKLNEVLDNVLLETLALDGYTLSQDFNSKNFSYTAEAKEDKNDFILSAKSFDLKCEIDYKFNYDSWKPMEQAKKTAPTLLQTGYNTITIRVTSKNKLKIQYYSIVVIKKIIQDALLSELLFSEGILTPTFSPETFIYTLEVANDSNEINLNCKSQDPNSSLTINTSDGQSGNNIIISSIPLNVNIMVYSSNESSNSYSVSIKKRTAKPVLDHDANTFSNPISVSITAQTGAEIYYTLNGNTPNESSTKYNGTPIVISQSTLLTAVAISNGWLISEPVSALYKIEGTVSPPTFDQIDEYSSNLPFYVIITAGANTTTYYTTDGSAPTNLSTQYIEESRVLITKDTYLQAISYHATYGKSTLAVAHYFINTYTITYNIGASTEGIAPPTCNGFYQETIYVPNSGTLKRKADGITYKFNGWSYGGNLYPPNAPYTIINNVFFTPVWSVIGGTTNANDIVFYDKGSVTQGWRYLAVAANDLSEASDTTFAFAVKNPGNDVTNTSSDVGTGKKNTLAIRTQRDIENDAKTAAQSVFNLDSGGITGYFIPSKDELQAIYDNRTLLGTFENAKYWSSTDTEDDDCAWALDFSTGLATSGNNHNEKYRVRPVRAFLDGDKSTFSVYYHGNGATGTPPVDDTHYESEFKFTVKPNSVMTNAPYNFNDWNINSDGSGSTAPVYTPGTSSKPIGNDLILYAQWSEFDGGNGSARRYSITTPEQLMLVSNYPDKKFSIKYPLDLTSISNWTPIGTVEKPFTGSLIGNTISNLKITSNADNSGLFGVVGNGADIQKVKLVNVSIVGGDNTGGLIGHVMSINMNHGIQNCSVTGTVKGKDYVGGLIGRVEKSSGSASIKFNILNCWSIANVSSTTQQYIGGLAGYLEISNVNYCYAQGNVNLEDTLPSSKYIGGFVGDFDKSSDELSKSTTIDNCYATGDVSGNSFVGGFIGGNDTEATSTIKTSYSAGKVTGTTNAGGFSGGTINNTTNCYYDNEKSTKTDSNAGVTGMTTTNMQVQTNFIGFNFSSTIWKPIDGNTYPYFQYQSPSENIPFP